MCLAAVTGFGCNNSDVSTEDIQSISSAVKSFPCCLEMACNVSYQLRSTDERVTKNKEFEVFHGSQKFLQSLLPIQR
jgi:hypothetical protein